MTPKLCSLVEDSVADVRNNHEITDILTKSRTREFQELQTFTKHSCKIQEIHPAPAQHLRKKQADNMSERIRRLNQDHQYH